MSHKFLTHSLTHSLKTCCWVVGRVMVYCLLVGWCVWLWPVNCLVAHDWLDVSKKLLCDASSPMLRWQVVSWSSWWAYGKNVSVLMSLALDHLLLHMESIVSLIDPWAVEPSVTPAFVLFKEPNVLVMVELSVFQELSVCTPLEQVPAAVALAK